MTLTDYTELCRREGWRRLNAIQMENRILRHLIFAFEQQSFIEPEPEPVVLPREQRRPEEARVLALFNGHPVLATDVARLTDKTLPAACLCLGRLVRGGDLKRVGKGLYAKA